VGARQTRHTVINAGERVKAVLAAKMETLAHAPFPCRNCGRRAYGAVGVLVRRPHGEASACTRLVRQGERATWTTWKSWVYLGILALALVGIVAFWSRRACGIAKIGRPAPDFTLYQLNGQKISLASLRGRPVLVDFWGST